MDKKSLLRILTRLGVKGQIKNITVKLELEDKTKARSLTIINQKNMFVTIYLSARRV